MTLRVGPQGVGRYEDGICTYVGLEYAGVTFIGTSIETTGFIDGKITEEVYPTGVFQDPNEYFEEVRRAEARIRLAAKKRKKAMLKTRIITCAKEGRFQETNVVNIFDHRRKRKTHLLHRR